MTLKIPENYIQVLDKGFVGYRNHMGDDNGPADAARVSFKKRAEDFTAEQNLKLVNYLLRNDEMACFRHDVLKLEVHAPLLVARQWFKYSVGSSHREDQFGWNESSRRYLTENNEYYVPAADQWRAAPANKKQGSGGLMPEDEGQDWTDRLESFISLGESWYEQMLEDGYAPEQARAFLPAYNLYVSWVWTASLQTIFHFLKERLDNHAQWEIQEYARAVLKIFIEHFPGVVELWWKHEYGTELPNE